MRTPLPWLSLLLAGCTPVGASQVIPGDPVGTCANVGGAEYAPATSGSFFANSFAINTQFQSLDSNSVTSCVRADGTGAAWAVNDQFGEPFMTVLMESTQTGAPDITTQTVLFDMFGADPPMQFSATDFATYQWTVSSLSPFNTTLNGNATNGAGHALQLQMTANATP